MIHGRFQPFHYGHLEYLRAARELCENLVIGITNPDPGQTAQDAASQHRHLPEANPYSYFERVIMIRDVLLDEGVSPERTVIIPFPVNYPELWHHYLPIGVVHFLRVFSQWEQAKVDRLREHGYQAEVIHPGVAKKIEATEVRRRMAAGEDWQALVPAPVARMIESKWRGEQPR